MSLPIFEFNSLQSFFKLYVLIFEFPVLRGVFISEGLKLFVLLCVLFRVEEFCYFKLFCSLILMFFLSLCFN